MMELRPYQKEAVEAIEKEWNVGHKRTLLVLPTGTGKTITFAQVAKDSVASGNRVLILAHRDELLTQAQDKIASATGLQCAKEKGQESSLDSFYRITVGSVQTMMREKRLDRFPPDHFQTIIVDEAHHCLADSYQRVLNHFPDANVLGVTATPERNNIQCLGEYFDSLAYEYTLPRAIRDGYLCRIKAMTIPLNLDIRSVKVTAGDYSAGQLGSAIEPYLEQIAVEMTKYCADRKTVAFLPLVSTAQHFRDILNRHGFKAAEVNGNSDDRAEILADFEAGKYNVLCNAMLLTEGWDCPSVDCVVMLRPTKIRALYCQCVGRGTRLYPGKKELFLPDFLWNTGRHDLCRPASLVCKKQEVADRMTRNLKDSAGEAIDIEDAEEAASRDVVAERENALAEALEAMKTKKRKLVDPIQFAFSISSEDLVDYTPTFAWEMAPASEKQIAFLENAGVFAEEIQNAGMASELIKRIKERRSLGLTTPKQIRVLERKGFKHVGEWPFAVASAMIDQIAQNNWHVPHGIFPPTYKPEGMDDYEQE